MLKFTIIIAILALINLVATHALTEEDLKDELNLKIIQTKNSAYEQVQAIKMLAATKVEKFIELVTDEVIKFRDYMETLKKKYGNNISCDKVQDDIDEKSLLTVRHFQSCVEKVLSYADYDLESLVSDARILTREIENAKNVSEELRQKIIDFSTKASFGKYVKQLEKCETQSNLVRLKRQISEALISYEQCLRNK